MRIKNLMLNIKFNKILRLINEIIELCDNNVLRTSTFGEFLTKDMNRSNKLNKILRELTKEELRIFSFKMAKEDSDIRIVYNQFLKQVHKEDDPVDDGMWQS